MGTLSLIYLLLIGKTLLVYCDCLFFFLINATLKIASHEEGFRHIQGPWEQAHHDYTIAARKIDGNQDKE